MNVTEVLAQAVERHHPRLVMLCSFQKEESVLVDELVRLAPDARIVTIDTGVLFPETLATWRAFEERFGVDVEIEDAHRRLDRPGALLRRAQGRRARARAGRRRRLDHRHPPRAVARPAPTRSRSSSTTSAGSGSSTRSSSGPRRTSGGGSTSATCPYNPLHDQGYASIGCAPCTSPGSGREGRWAGLAKTECGLHV